MWRGRQTWGDASTSRPTRDGQQAPGARAEAGSTFCLAAHRRNQACQHLDLRLPASLSCCLSLLVGGTLLQQPWGMNSMWKRTNAYQLLGARNTSNIIVWGNKTVSATKCIFQLLWIYWIYLTHTHHPNQDILWSKREQGGGFLWNTGG